MILEYIWVDGFGNLRSKTRYIKQFLIYENIKIEEIPEWNYDGSSTGQASGDNSEVILKPCAIYNDPFRKNNNKLVLCETYYSDGTPHITNTRFQANSIFEKNLEKEPMFGIEQEFFITKNKWPIGFPENRNNYPEPQQHFYCSTGGDYSIGRDCVEQAFNNSIYAGLDITGLNAEVAPSQWEIQICTIGIEAADQLYILRYILNRTAEEYGWAIDYHPKPIKEDWNGSGCHTNFSTKAMREEGGYEVILDAITKLGEKHNYHMERYGLDNNERMTGKHETASYDTFSYGVADRGSCIRIPREVEKNRKGYFEDRRPISNMDPYVVTSLILDTLTN